MDIFEEIHNEFINSDLFLQYIYELSTYNKQIIIKNGIIKVVGVEIRHKENEWGESPTG
jgi:hypothetical protein